MAHILLVEDEVVVAITTGMVLEDEGHRVDLAYDGANGLEAARVRNPDIVITDYMMPRMDGLVFIQTLRAEGFTGPIVLATSVPDSQLPANYEGGHDVYVSKPYSADQIISLVARLVA